MKRVLLDLWIGAGGFFGVGRGGFLRPLRGLGWLCVAFHGLARRFAACCCAACCARGYRPAPASRALSTDLLRRSVAREAGARLSGAYWTVARGVGVRAWVLGVAGALLAGAVVLGQPAGEGERVRGGGSARFGWVDVYVDSGDAALAAYQVDLRAVDGGVAIVGIEGGEHRAFAAPPYYDARAMRGDRVIIGALDAGEELPRGRTRVARVHVMVTGEGEPVYAVELTAAAGVDGEKIEATVSLGEGR